MLQFKPTFFIAENFTMLHPQRLLFPSAMILLIFLSGCQMSAVKQRIEPLLAKLSPRPPVLLPIAALDATCVSRCARAQTQCEKRQQLRETECQQQFSPTQTQHNDCIANQQPGCLQAVACLGADLSLCKTQHQECLRTCPPAKTPPPAVAPTAAPAPAR